MYSNLFNQLFIVLILTLFTPYTYGTPQQKTLQSHKHSKAQITKKIDIEQRQVAGGKVKIESLMQGNNAFVGRLILAAHQKIPIHRDPTEEYLYIIEGSGQITINGKTYTINAGDSVYMPAKAMVSFVNGDQTLIAFQVFAGVSSAQKYQKWPLVKKP